MDKNCSNCYLNLGSMCKVLTEKIHDNCWAWADKEEAKRREEDIKNYREGFILEDNSPRAKLQRNFERLYKKELSDDAIARELKISSSSVRNYRKELELESNYLIKRSLLSQANKK
jgi:threonine synthase